MAPSAPWKLAKGWIEDIPDATFESLSTSTNTGMWKNDNIHIDMQGMTSDKPAKHNVQVQVNARPALKSFQKYASQTIAMYLAPSGKDEPKGQSTKAKLLEDLDMDKYPKNAKPNSKKKRQEVTKKK
jgi:TFIIF-interacting CTD phosphatase-like protein